MASQGRPSSLAVQPAPAHTPASGADQPACTYWGKHACDFIVGLALLIPALPVIAVVWAVVRLTSSGPGFYSQVRIGQGGRPYRIFKIRTMTHNCEARSGAKWATKGDSRITPVGRVLRKLHLDELPQLWNVLRGEMSLVGPRPERPEFVAPLSREVEAYGERHRVRPGVTGLAQIQLPPDTDVGSVRTKIVLDRHYVENASLWLDLRIMLGTGVYLAGFSYARVRRLLWLPNPLAGHPRAAGDGVHELCGVAQATGAAVPAAPVAHATPCGEMQ